MTTQTGAAGFVQPGSTREGFMVVATRKADQRARIVLPDDFANETVVIERLGANELRLRKKKTLAQLVAGITPENLHGEWETGPAVGGEVL
jgi:hypothetical protein